MTAKPWFGILGPLAAGVDGGMRLELGGRKQRELLALLLINLNRCTPAGRIADALWRGAPPAGADVTLRSHVSHLRQLALSVSIDDHREIMAAMLEGVANTPIVASRGE